MNRIGAESGGSTKGGGGFSPTGIDSIDAILYGVCIFLLIGFGLLALGTLLCGIVIIYKTLGFLFDTLSNGGAPHVITSILQSAIAGVFAGVASTLLRRLFSKPWLLSKSFLSAMFTKDLAAPSPISVLVGKVVIGGLVGALVGALMGASGGISFTHILSHSGSSVFYDQTFPIIGILGPGGEAGGKGCWGFGLIIEVVLAIVFLSVLYGLLSGYLLHCFLALVTGATKGTTKSYTEYILEDRTSGKDERKDKGELIADGMRRGALTGLLSGIVQAICTSWGIMTILRANTH